MLGMTVAQTLRRKTKITITTRATVRSRVNWTSRTEARIVWVRSLKVVTWIAGGIAAVSWGRAAMILSTVAMTLAPGCLKMIRKMPGLPSAQAAWVLSWGALTAVPMSRTRSGLPLRQATMASFQSLAAVIWSLV